MVNGGLEERGTQHITRAARKVSAAPNHAQWQVSTIYTQ